MPFFSKKAEPTFISAVIAAAGSASRMEGLDKQQALLGGVPVVARSIAAFNAHPDISEVVVVCRGEQIPDYYDLVRFYGFEKVTSVVAGGETRQSSIFAGIGACSENSEYFAIHDGARPLVTAEEIALCIDAAIETGAAATGVPSKDTMKLCDEKGVIISTPKRENLWAVQTPQIFEAALYRRAMAAALRDCREYTDDCQLIENFGHSVVISQGSYENIKITTPGDLIVAEAILEYREGGGQAWNVLE